MNFCALMYESSLLHDPGVCGIITRVPDRDQVGAGVGGVIVKRQGAVGGCHIERSQSAVVHGPGIIILPAFSNQGDAVRLAGVKGYRRRGKRYFHIRGVFNLAAGEQHSDGAEHAQRGACLLDVFFLRVHE